MYLYSLTVVEIPLSMMRVNRKTKRLEGTDHAYLCGSDRFSHLFCTELQQSHSTFNPACVIPFYDSRPLYTVICKSHHSSCYTAVYFGSSSRQSENIAAQG